MSKDGAEDSAVCFPPARLRGMGFPRAEEVWWKAWPVGVACRVAVKLVGFGAVV